MTGLFISSVALIVYTFLGYPALIAAWARLRPRPVRVDPGHTPRVSLIIAAYNEAGVIRSKLANCRGLDYPQDRLEILVAADGSDDGTERLAQGEAGVRVLFEPERRGKMAALNRAVPLATGDFLVFSDANNTYTPGTLRALLAPFADPRVGVVTGRKAIDDGTGRPLDRAEGLYWRYESKIKGWESRIDSVSGIAGEVLAMRREAFVPVPEATINDDFVLGMQAALAGWRVIYAPEAISLERASATLGDEATRRSRIVAGRYQALWRLLPELLRRRPRLAWQVISHKGLRPLVPFAMLLCLLSNLGAIGTGRARWPRIAAALQAGFYGSALLGWWNERRGRRNRWLYLPYYFCRVNGAAIAGLAGFLGGREDVLWAKARRAAPSADSVSGGDRDR